MKALLSLAMECPDAETLADLAQTPGDLEQRAAIADHASECESCRAVLAAVFGAPPKRERIGRYLVGRRLGSGGMGVVYQARDPELQREVAIKMLYRGAPAERLRREAQALARLAHPNVVAVYDVGEHEGQTFIAMALVDGETLRRWLAIERSGREIMRVLCAAARGIEAAHAARLVHRDLKPDNVFVARDGNSLVGDFGLARDRSPGDSLTGLRAGDIPIGDAETLVSGEARGGVDLTETGTVLGTPAYMAPEQAAGAATELSDQFSFCVMAYEALNGCRPFAGANLDELCTAAERGEVRAPRRDPGVGPAVERALRRGLSANPAERFPTMTALRLAIEPRPRRWPMIAGGVAALAAASAITWVVSRPAALPDPEVTCAGTRTQFTDTWNPTKRARWIAAAHANGALEDAASELAARLDRFADGWTSQRYETCVEQTTGAVDDLRAARRNACLDTRRVEFEATIGNTSPEDALALWRRVAALSEPAACRDASHAFGSGYQALVLAAARARTVDELAAVATRAEREGDQRAQLSLSLSLAARALADNRLADADARARRAVTLAEALAQPFERVRALSLSARALCASGKQEEADRFLEIAEAASRSQTDALDEVHDARATCLAYRRDFAEAVPMLVAMLERVTRRYGRDSFEAYELHHRLIEAYQALGQQAGFARHMDEWNRLFIKLVGGADAVLETQINDALLRGDLDAAIDYQRRIAANQLHFQRPGLAGSLEILGNLYEVAGDWQAAITSYDRALQVLPDATDEQALKTRASALVGRGEDHLRLGHFELAAADFKASLAYIEKVKRADLLLRVQLGSGRVAAEQGDHARAIRILLVAIPALIKANTPTRLTLAEAQFALARAQWQRGDKPASRLTAREAEANFATAIDDAIQQPITQKLIPYRRGRLRAIETWRADHP